jgi:hypothetical protein
MGTGIILSSKFGPPKVAIGVPIRVDGYLGYWGLGGELRIPTFSPFVPEDGYQFLVFPVTIAAGPRLRVGHAASLFSLTFGVNGALEMGRGSFLPGDTDRFGWDKSEVLKRVWMTNGLFYGSIAVGLKIHTDFYAFLAGDGGIRIPEKTFVIDETSSVTFKPSPLANIAMGVEVRLP